MGYHKLKINSAVVMLMFLHFGASQYDYTCDSTTTLTSTFTAQTFNSPNYPSNYDSNDEQCWTIGTGGVSGLQIIVSISAFSVDGTGSCLLEEGSDVLAIFDIAYVPDARALGELCEGSYNADTTRTYISASFNLYIYLGTSASTESTGFRISYLHYSTSNDDGCPGSVSASTTASYWTGPSFPAAYIAETSCYLTVSTSNLLSYVQADIIFIDIFNSDGSCSGDTLTFYDGADAMGTQLGQVCGNSLSNSDSATTFSSTGTQMYIFFVSGTPPNSYYGFVLSILQVDLDFVCSSTTDLASSDDVQTISSPNYPSNYNANDEKCWKISSTAVSNTQLIIAFTSFNVHGTGSCSRTAGSDILAIFYGSDSVTGTLLVSLCSDTFNAATNRLYLATGGIFYLYFMTSSSNQLGGFELQYVHYLTTSLASCDANLPSGLTGTYSPGPNLPSYYTDSNTCSYTITSALGGTIQADIVFIDLQNNDGSCTTDTLTFTNVASLATTLGTVCGNPLSDGGTKTFTSTAATMGMTLVSDATGSTQYYGFIVKFTELPLTYTCVNTITTFTASSAVQTFSSTNYPSSYNALTNECWQISPSGSGKTVVVAFSAFDVTGASQCLVSNDEDVVVIFDGTSTATGTNRGVLCSGTFSADTTRAYTSTNGFVVYFESGATVQANGFQMVYIEYDTAYSQACGSSLTATTAGFYHHPPNLPSYYTNSLTCSFSISASSGKAVEVSIAFTDMRNNDGSCTIDHLSLYDGTNGDATKLADLCGNPMNDVDGDVYTSTGSNLFLEFTSDDSGFATYFGYIVKITELDIPTACNQGLSLNAIATDTTFTSENYPSDYDKSSFCRWTLTAPTNYAVRVTITALTLEDSTYCVYDKLSAYDGSSNTSSLLGEYCATSYPANYFESTGTTMYIQFISDAAYHYSGFSLNFKSVDVSYPGCKSSYTQLTAVAGDVATGPTISSTNYPSAYTNYLDQYWLILNPTGGNLVLELKSMDIESATDCPYDRITVYNGGCPSFSVYQNLCGTFNHRLELTGTEYLVRFHSDGSVTKLGFQMAYFLGTHGLAALTTSTTTVGPLVEVEVALMNEILSDYNPETSPSRDLSVALETEVDMYFVGVNDLDEVAQMLTTTALFKVKWTDESLRWSIGKNSDIVQMLIPQNDIWRPDVALLNGFTAITEMGSKFMFVVVDYTGVCTWRPYQIMQTACEVDMTFYPFDVQSCDLKFGTWGSSSDQVKTNIGKNGLQIHENFVQNAEWTLLSNEVKNETIGTQDIVTFTLIIKRNPTFTNYYMTVPIVLLAFMNAFIFVLPTGSGETSGVAMTIFLSFMVYVIIIFQRMPPNSDKLSKFALYTILLTVLSAISVMLSVFQLRLSTLNAQKQNIPSWIQKVTKGVMKVIDVVMCVSDTKKYREGGTEVKATVDWNDVISAMDLIFFFVFIIVTVILTLYFMLDVTFS